MKLNYLIIFLSIGIILLGLGAGGAIAADETEVISGRRDHHEDRTPESYKAATISKGTILLLLAVGVIGALGVSRKKNGNGSRFDRAEDDMAEQSPDGANEDRQKLIGHNF